LEPEAKKLINDAIDLHIKDILKNDLKFNTQKVDETFKEFIKTKDQNSFYELDFLCDRLKLKQIINQFLLPSEGTSARKSPYDNCLSQIKKNIIDILPSEIQNPEDRKAFETFIKEDKCIAVEICKLNPDRKSLLTEVKTYIAAQKFSSSPANVNIVNETHATIYDVIRELIIDERKFNAVKANCIIENMKRSRKIDEIYKPELLFNTAALKVKVNPIVDDYERKYSNPIFA
jgi:hypothetical protein